MMHVGDILKSVFGPDPERAKLSDVNRRLRFIGRLQRREPEQQEAF